MGQLDRLRTELPESAEPIVPPRWGELNTITIAFGHGLAVAPLQALMAVGALVNGGILIKPTFLKRDRGGGARKRGVRVIKPETSEAMRYRHAPQRRPRARPASAAIAGYLRRRQDRHGREGHRRPLLQEPRLFTTFMADLRRPTSRNTSS